MSELRFFHSRFGEHALLDKDCMNAEVKACL
jgi:hypothetical protein